MKIQGSNSTDGPFEELYRDAENRLSCVNHYNDIGTSICGNILLINITSTHMFQIVKISTASYLTLCEVEVFGGKLLILL